MPKKTRENSGIYVPTERLHELVEGSARAARAADIGSRPIDDDSVVGTALREARRAISGAHITLGEPVLPRSKKVRKP